jgi:hypothetical protein
MTTGEALMLRAWTVGVVVGGRFALAIASVTAAVVSFTFVPNENWVTTSEIEFDEVDWMISRRGTPLIAFSIGFVTCSVTSDEPAPGYGVTTVMTGKSMSGSSSCFRLPHAEAPAMNRAPANRSVTLRLLRATRLRRLTVGSPAGGGLDGGSGIGTRGAVDGSKEDRERSAHHVEFLVIEPTEELAELAQVEFAEALEQRCRGRGRGDDDLATIVGVVVPQEQAEFDEAVGHLARGRGADPEPGSKFRHPQPAGGHHHVQHFGLRHRDAHLGELRRVRLHEPMHHPVVPVDDRLDLGGGRASVHVRWNVRWLRTIRSAHTISVQRQG